MHLPRKFLIVNFFFFLQVWSILLDKSLEMISAYQQATYEQLINIYITQAVLVGFLFSRLSLTVDFIYVYFIKFVSLCGKAK